MQQAYPELGMRPARTAAARPIAVRPPEANLGFTRIVYLGIRALSTDNVRCRVGVAAGAVKRPRFSSNLSTFMFNCILVVTTLERHVSGAAAPQSSHRRTLIAPVRILPAWGFFPCSTCSSPRRLFAPRIQPCSSTIDCITRNRAYSCNAKFDVIHFFNKKYTRQESNLLVSVEGCQRRGVEGEMEARMNRK